MILWLSDPKSSHIYRSPWGAREGGDLSLSGLQFAIDGKDVKHLVPMKQTTQHSWSISIHW